MRQALPVVAALLLLASSTGAAAAADARPAAVSAEEGWWRHAYGVGRLDPALDAEDAAAAFLRSIATSLAPERASFHGFAAKRSLTGTHVGFEQRWEGVPVAGGTVTVHALASGEVVAVHSGAITEAEPGETRIGEAEAAVSAAEATGGSVERVRYVLLADGRIGRPAFEVDTVSKAPLAHHRAFVSALTGALLRVDELGHHATAPGSAWINPITEGDDPKLRDRSLTLNVQSPLNLDPGSAERPDFSAYYRDVELFDLEETPLGPRLSGPHVRVVDGLARGDEFRFEWDDTRFAETNVYHWIDQSQRYVQSLGFDDLANTSTRVRMYEVHDGSMFVAGGGYVRGDQIWFGPWPALEVSRAATRVAYRGMANSAVDADVVLHEYAHVLVNNATIEPPTSILHEGSADFWMSTQIGRLVGAPYDTCEGEWSRSYSWSLGEGPLPCFRNVRNNLSYSDELVAAYEGVGGHYVGQIWSGSLWNLRERWGPDAVDTLLLESLYWFPPGADLRDAAAALLTADYALTGAARGREIGEELARRNLSGLVVTPELFEALRGAAATVEQDAPAAVPAAAVATVALAAGLAAARRRRA